jgi:hypothetical protein
LSGDALAAEIQQVQADNYSTVFRVRNTNRNTRNIQGAEFLYVSVKRAGRTQGPRVDITFDQPPPTGPHNDAIYATPGGDYTDPGGGHNVLGETQQDRIDRIARNSRSGKGTQQIFSPQDLDAELSRRRTALGTPGGGTPGEGAPGGGQSSPYSRKGIRGYASVPGLLGVMAATVGVAGTVTYLGKSKNLSDLAGRVEGLVADAVVGAGLGYLMGTASPFLVLEGDNPEIARSRETMEFIRTHFPDYSERSAEDFAMLYDQVYDLLYPIHPIQIEPFYPYGAPEKSSMVPAKRR